MFKLAVLLASATLTGCATIVTGSSQTLTVTTTPPGASCVIDRAGDRVGAIATTPGSITIGKSKNDLSVTCSKEGFETATLAHPANFNGVTFGNILLGGVVGIVVDMSTGANFYYSGDVRMDMPATKPTAAVIPAMAIKPIS